MLGGAVLGKSDPLVERLVTATLGTGAPSSLGAAGKIVTSLAALTTSCISTVAFPTLARLAAAGQVERVGQTLTRFVGQTFMLVMPLAAFMALFRREIVRFLFQHGQFTAAMTEQVAVVVGCFSGFFVLSGIGSILSRGFYTLGKTRIPAAISIAGTGVYLTLALVLSRLMGVAGAALALSLEYLFGFLCQLVMLRRYYAEFAPLLIIRKALEYGGWAGFSGLIVYTSMSHLHALPEHRFALCLSLGMGALLLGIVYFGGLLLVQEPDAVALGRRLRLHWLSRRQPVAAPVAAPIE
jgi:putative peptidoglycan lipid II flippase